MIPSFLTEDDLILVVAPAFSANEEEVRNGILNLKKIGFRVETGPNVFSSWGKFAGTDADRKADLQWALDHPEAKAIFCTRGGYGLGRILSDLSFNMFQSKPKWFIGFSDITLLHLRLNSLGVSSLHGPMVVHFSRPEQSVACTSLVRILNGELPSVLYPLIPERQDAQGINGPLAGGNLTMISHSAGKLKAGVFSGSVLFLEEIGEYFYRIDRMLEQLRQSGMYEGVKAVVLGQFTDCEPDRFPLSLLEMVKEKLPEGVPLFSGLESGHGVPTYPLVFGTLAEIEKSETGFRLIQRLRPVTS
ncbi:MAG TPA: LD-carboxypeptidase [Catalimonadaceae bacterium]|mgnify:FL=1|nr:LD-carboxypeptidase [Catalimonadaceae bacterium]